ncbi:MAG: hypothetical protein H6502_00025 [Candidatus Woesearchaeota archaeon]|nr:MAG: hypothetical protein H6502_00025 [Candidatus Woesearchaeota archaeon]
MKRKLTSKACVLFIVLLASFAFTIDDIYFQESSKFEPTILENRIIPSDVVNLATGMPRITFTMDALPSTSVQIVPKLVYTDGVRLTERRINYIYDPATPGPTHRQDSVYYDEDDGFLSPGWNLESFGFISHRMIPAASGNGVDDQYILALPGKESNELVFLQREIDGNQVTETYELLGDPRIHAIHKKRITGVLHGGALDGEQSYEDEGWVVTTSDGYTYRYSHAQYSRKRVNSALPEDEPLGVIDGQDRIDLYMKFFYRWDVTLIDPPGLDNEVVFSYAPVDAEKVNPFSPRYVPSTLNQKYDLYNERRFNCLSANPDQPDLCNLNEDLARDVSEIYYDAISYTSAPDFFATDFSYPTKLSEIIQHDNRVSFSYEVLDEDVNVLFTADPQEGVHGGWHIYCRNQAAQGCSPEDVFLDDDEIQLFGLQQGTSWGMYVLFDNLEPYTSYKLVGEIDYGPLNEIGGTYRDGANLFKIMDELPGWSEYTEPGMSSLDVQNGFPVYRFFNYWYYIHSDSYPSTTYHPEFGYRGAVPKYWQMNRYDAQGELLDPCNDEGTPFELDDSSCLGRGVLAWSDSYIVGPYSLDGDEDITSTLKQTVTYDFSTFGPTSEDRAQRYIAFANYLRTGQLANGYPRVRNLRLIKNEPRVVLDTIKIQSGKENRFTYRTLKEFDLDFTNGILSSINECDKIFDRCQKTSFLSDASGSLVSIIYPTLAKISFLKESTSVSKSEPNLWRNYIQEDVLFPEIEPSSIVLAHAYKKLLQKVDYPNIKNSNYLDDEYFETTAGTYFFDAISPWKRSSTCILCVTHYAVPDYPKGIRIFDDGESFQDEGHGIYQDIRYDLEPGEEYTLSVEFMNENLFGLQGRVELHPLFFDVSDTIIPYVTTYADAVFNASDVEEEWVTKHISFIVPVTYKSMRVEISADTDFVGSVRVTKAMLTRGGIEDAGAIDRYETSYDYEEGVIDTDDMVEYVAQITITDSNEDIRQHEFYVSSQGTDERLNGREKTVSIFEKEGDTVRELSRSTTTYELIEEDNNYFVHKQQIETMQFDQSGIPGRTLRTVFQEADQQSCYQPQLILHEEDIALSSDDYAEEFAFVSAGNVSCLPSRIERIKDGEILQKKSINYYEDVFLQGLKKNETHHVLDEPLLDMVVTYSYDAYRNLVSQSDVLGTETTYTYLSPLQGLVATKTNALGQTTVYEYNQYNQLSRTRLPSGISYYYEYGPFGVVNKVQEKGVATRSFYQGPELFEDLSRTCTVTGSCLCDSHVENECQVSQVIELQNFAEDDEFVAVMTDPRIIVDSIILDPYQGSPFFDIGGMYRGQFVIPSSSCYRDYFNRLICSAQYEGEIIDQSEDFTSERYFIFGKVDFQDQTINCGATVIRCG